MVNIDPKLWGPSTWKFLHYVTISYPNEPNAEIKKSAYLFFSSLKDLLPCQKCRLNFGHHLQKHPLTNDILSSRTRLINWLIDIHNDVNQSVGKPTLTYQQALAIYLNPTIESFSNTIIPGINTRLLTIIISIIFIVILIILIKLR